MISKMDAKMNVCSWLRMNRLFNRVTSDGSDFTGRVLITVHGWNPRDTRWTELDLRARSRGFMVQAFMAKEESE